MLRRISTALLKSLTVPLIFHYYVNKNQKERQSFLDFKKKTQYTENIQKMIELYQVTDKPPEYFSSYFVIACRGFSRIIRRAQDQQYFNMNVLLGSQMEELHKIKIQELTLEDIAQICNFFNMTHSKFFINSTNCTLKNFLEKIIQRSLTKEEKNIDKSRLLTYLFRSLRSTQIYQLDHFYYLTLQKLPLYSHEFSFFGYLSIFNSIFRGNPSTRTTELELKLIKMGINQTLSKKWIQISSPHHYVDLLAPIVDFQSLLAPVISKELILGDLWQVTEKYLQKNYQKMTNEEFIRFIKLLNQINPYSKLLTEATTAILSRISPATGESSIDPIFIIRFLSHHKNFHLYSTVDPKWEEKLYKMIKYYFVEEGVFIRPVFNGIYVLMQNMTNNETIRQMNELMVKFIMEGDIKLSVKPQIELYILVFKMAVKKQEFPTAIRMMQKINTLFESSLEKQCFYFYLFLEENKNFMRKLGLPVNIARLNLQKKNSFFSSTLSPQKEGDVNRYLLKVAIFDANICKSLKNVKRINIIYLELAIQMLEYNFKMEEFIDLMFQLDLNSSVMEIIMNQMINVPIPRHLQSKFMDLAKTYLKEKNSFTSICFNMLRKSKKKRPSKPQAQYLMDLIKQQPRKEQCMYLADRYALEVFCSFMRHETISVLLDLSQSHFQRVEFSLLNVLVFLDRNCEDIDEILELGNKILSFPQISALVKDSVVEIMDRYRENCSKRVSTIHGSAIWGKQNFSLSEKENVRLLKDYAKKMDVDKLEGLEREKKLLEILRVLTFLCNNKCMDDKNDSKMLFKIFSPFLIKYSQSMVYNSTLILKAFMISVDLQWHIPQLFRACTQILAQSSWKSSIDSKQILTRLLKYPLQKQQVAENILNCIEMFVINPEETFRELQYLYSMCQDSVKHTQIRNYFSYLQTIKFLNNTPKRQFERCKKEDLIGVEKENGGK